MVTHDPSAAAAADRVLFLADGLIVSDLDRPSRAEVIAGLEEVTNR
jgi:putative ABC transport system ATP-binding protein